MNYRHPFLLLLILQPGHYVHRKRHSDARIPFRAHEVFSCLQRVATFTILGELIEFSCMDLLDDLRATRIAIEKSPKATELRAKLAHFPFDQAEAIRRAKKWSSASPADQLRLQRQWTSEFREEYRLLREEADRRASSVK